MAGKKKGWFFLSFYLYNLVRSLSRTKLSYSFSDDCIILMSICSFIYHFNGEDPYWEKILNTLGGLLLDLKVLEEEFYDIEDEIRNGNVVEIPASLKDKYCNLIGYLLKIEAKIISAIDEVIEVPSSASLFVPEYMGGRFKD